MASHVSVIMDFLEPYVKVVSTKGYGLFGFCYAYLGHIYISKHILIMIRSFYTFHSFRLLFLDIEVSIRGYGGSHGKCVASVIYQLFIT